MLTSTGDCGDNVGDIEDCVLPGDALPSARIRAENRVLPRALRRRVTRREKETALPPKEKDEEEDVPACESFIPGTHSVYIKTWGCSHNNSDGEYMAGLLGASGYSITGKVIDRTKIMFFCHLIKKCGNYMYVNVSQSRR